MKIRWRPALILAGFAGVLAYQARGQQAARPAARPVLDLREVRGVPIGSLGVPLGTYVTIEGVQDLQSMAMSFYVDTINGTKLARPIPIALDDRFDDEKQRHIVNGYENIRMVGLPPAIEAAARANGQKPPIAAQVPWGLSFHFTTLPGPPIKDKIAR